MVGKSLGRRLAIPQQSFFLLGARGTGKSTWMRTCFPAAVRIDLLDQQRYQDYLARPAELAEELRALAPGTTVCIDEVQRLPGLLNEVHRFLEDRQLRFVLCGSSARKLRQAGTNLLAGRPLRRDLHPFVPAELGSEFELDAALRYGTLPLVWRSSSRAESLAAYARMYLREEIQAEALVRNLPGFARFLPIAALFHGQALNLSSLARDAQVSRTTASGYIEVLEDTLLAFRLPAYETKLRVREKRHPKLYWIDAGIVRAVRGNLGPASREELGPLFEGWIANLLRIHNDYDAVYDQWGYWSPAEALRTEVDFVLRRGRELLAIEVKASAQVRDEDLRGLAAIAELPGLVRRVLVCRVERRRKTAAGIEIWPIERFHEALADQTLWP
jgi:predicted AAA+ superfamily ATPase